MDARYLLHSGNRKSLASSDGIYTEARLVILVPGHLYGLSSVTVSDSKDTGSGVPREDSAPGIRLHGHRP